MTAQSAFLTSYGRNARRGAASHNRGVSRLYMIATSFPSCTSSCCPVSSIGARAASTKRWDLYNSTLDVPTQIQLLAQMEKIVSEEVPWIPLFYTPLITPFVAGLTGAKQRSYGDTDTLSRIWEWQWSS